MKKRILIISLFLICSIFLSSCSIMYKPSDVKKKIVSGNYDLSVEHSYLIDDETYTQKMNVSYTSNVVHYQSDGYLSTMNVYLFEKDGNYFRYDYDYDTESFSEVSITEEEFLAGHSMFGENQEATINALFDNSNYTKTSRFHYINKDGVDFSSQFSDYTSVQMELGDGTCEITVNSNYREGTLVSTYKFSHFGSVTVSLPILNQE